MGLLLRVSLSALLPLLLLLPTRGAAQTPGPAEPLLQRPHDVLWASGRQDYQLGLWGEAARQLEGSLLGRSALRRLRAACTERCPGDPLPAGDTGDPLPAGDTGDPPRARDTGDLLSQIAFFGRLLRRAACLRQCLGAGMGEPSRHRIGPEVSAAFRARSPYNYLQLCYFKMGQLDKAAAAAQTFLEANRDHEEMLDNIAMYRRMEGVKSEDFRDLEAQPHWVSYEQSSSLYEGEKFSESSELLERAVGEFLSALEECRAQCLGPAEFKDYSYLEYQSHLHETIADHFVQVLSCNQECVRELGTRGGPSRTPQDLLPSIFSLLQYAYHRLGDYERAVECSRTFLLFHPQDRAMLQNLDFFRSRLDREWSEVRAREDISRYVERSLSEKRLLYFAVEQMGHDFTDPDSWTPPEIVPESVTKKQQMEGVKAQTSAPENETSSPAAEPKRGLDVLRAYWPALSSLSLTLDWEALRGDDRAVLDGALTHRECEQLRALANAADELSPGHRGQGSRLEQKPPTGGLTLLRALQLASDGTVDRAGTLLYHQLIERSRMITDHHFRHSRPLHLSSSHLACRSAAAAAGEQTDPSVAPSGGCLLEPEGHECSEVGAADGARDFSVHLYLNDEFEGGNFLFKDLDTQSVTVEVTPKCGRLLTYRWHEGTSHGVAEVRGGQRCALTLWYTLNSKLKTKERTQIQALWKQLSPEPLLPLRVDPHPRNDSRHVVHGSAEEVGRQQRLRQRREGPQRDEL